MNPSQVIISILVILFLMLSGLPLPSFVPAVSAQSPSCGDTITTSTTLSADIGPCSGNGLVIGANGFALNCAGHNISGLGASSAPNLDGITVISHTGVTVMNCNVRGFSGNGFYISGSSGDSLTGNTANSNGYVGFNLTSSSRNALSGNTANDNIGRFGFSLVSSTLNTLIGNTADDNGHDLGNAAGFYLWHSDENTLTGNTAASNALGFYVVQSSQDAFTNNTAEYDVVGFGLITCEWNTLTGNTVNHNGLLAFELSYSFWNAFTGNTANNNWSGFYISHSNSNEFNGNTANDNGNNAGSEIAPRGYGFFLDNSADSNILHGNIANNNKEYGYYDLSTGSGTAGTANLYTLETCGSNGEGGSSPNGLCVLIPFLVTVLSSSTIAVGGSVTDTAALTGATSDAAGKVTYEYFSGNTCSGSPTAAGSPTNVTNGTVPYSSSQTFNTPGYFSWKAIYSGDDYNVGAMSGCEQLTVYNTPLLTLTVSCNNASLVVGSATTCKAMVRGFSSAPIGSVAWSSDSPGKFSKLTCTLSKGACSVKFTPASAGSSVTVATSYQRTPSEPPFTGTFTLTVTQKASKTTVFCSPASVTAASSKTVTCKVKVTGYSPTGTASWSQDGAGSVSFASATCTLSQGTCSVMLTGSTSGHVTITATYTGDPDNQSSSRTAKLTIKSA